MKAVTAATDRFFFLFLQTVSIEYKIQSYRDKLNRGILTV